MVPKSFFIPITLPSSFTATPKLSGLQFLARALFAALCWLLSLVVFLLLIGVPLKTFITQGHYSVASVRIGFFPMLLPIGLGILGVYQFLSAVRRRLAKLFPQPKKDWYFKRFIWVCVGLFFLNQSLLEHLVEVTILILTVMSTKYALEN